MAIIKTSKLESVLVDDNIIVPPVVDITSLSVTKLNTPILSGTIHVSKDDLPKYKHIGIKSTGLWKIAPITHLDNSIRYKVELLSCG